MHSLRTSLALILSGVVHTGIIVVLASRTVATYLPVSTFAPMEVVAAPPPKPPPPEPPPPEPLPTPPETQVRSLQPTPRSNPIPKAEPAPEPQPEQAPVALAGVSLSNSGIAMPQGNGSGFGGRIAAAVAKPAPAVVAPAPAPSALQLTSLADLSRKPFPPALDAALARHYPVHLRSSGVEGQALVRVIVGRAGEVRTTTLLSETHNGFGSACLKALEKSRWGPPIDQSGNPTATSLQYRCRFTVGL